MTVRMSGSSFIMPDEPMSIIESATGRSNAKPVIPRPAATRNERRIVDTYLISSLVVDVPLFP